MRRVGRVLGMVAVLLAVAVSTAAKTTYTVTDLGTLGGYNSNSKIIQSG